MLQQPSWAPSAGSPFPTGEGPADVVAIDVNQDGRFDLVTANQADSSLTILLGQGDDAFLPSEHSPVPLSNPPHLLAAGDFNQDGYPDVAVSSHDSWDVAVMLGDGRGSLAAAPGSPFAYLSGNGQPHNHGLAAGDVNADGHLDLLAVDQNDSSVSLLLGDGRGGFSLAPNSPYSVGPQPYPAALADLDGDGRLDVVVPNMDGSSVSVLYWRDDGFHQADGSPFVTASRPFQVAAGDVNSDQRPDLLVIHDDSPELTLLLATEAGFEPSPHSPIQSGGNGWKLQLADLNRDGNRDLAISCWRCGVLLLEGDRAGRFRPAPNSPFPAGSGVSALTLADLDSDGQPEIIATASDDNTLTILRLTQE